MLEVKQLSKRFGRAGMACEAVSFVIAPGELFGLVGASGCGKTTVANLILRLLEPDAGEVLIDGTPITALHGYRQLRPVRRLIQCVPQAAGASLNPHMTLAQIITEPLNNYAIPTGTRVTELLALVGLPPEWGRRRPAQLSGGERQRVAIARALALGPKVLILDEVTSNLDVLTAQNVITLLRDIHRATKLSMLFISHDIALTNRFCHRKGVMQHGRMLEIVSDLKDAVHPYTRSLIEATIQGRKS